MNDMVDQNEMTEGRRPLIRPFSRRSFLKVGAATGIGGALATGLGDFIGTAAAASSAVRDENALPGGRPTNGSRRGPQTIVGYTPALSYAPGESVAFKVSTASPSWRISVYRLGWYGGNGARRVPK